MIEYLFNNINLGQKRSIKVQRDRQKIDKTRKYPHCIILKAISIQDKGKTWESARK